jgi:5-methylcytosine-specific restriction endonuclease McrA
MNHAERYLKDDDYYAMDRAGNSRRKAALRNAVIDPEFTDRELADMLIMSAGCPGCEPVVYLPLRERIIDHIVPIVNGGKHTADNIQILCDEHHKEKTANEISDWWTNAKRYQFEKAA